MRIYTLKRQQLIRRPLGEVFSFFSKPENLAILTPKKLGFQILSPLPIPMKEGALIDYTIRLIGLPVRWTTLISLYEPPHRFVDVQIKGPYSYWHHTHSFAACDDGTVVSDEVRYAMRLGIIGQMIHELAVKRELNRIFTTRRHAIERIFQKK